MAQSMWEQTGEHFSDAAQKAAEAASAVSDAVGDGVTAARRAAKDSSDAAAELFYDTKKRVRRYPVEAVGVTFAVGIAVGALIGWMMGRK